MAKRFKFSKPIVETSVEPLSKDYLWVDIEESTGKILTLKEFIEGEWKVILTSVIPEYSNEYKAALTDALSVEDLTSLVTDLAEALGYTLTENSSSTTVQDTTPIE